uniref:WW domain-containing protein n=1 Tax=Moniliophthora roreri TaxID=221103 RepID=A0A0W0FRH9_MONRR
MNDIQSYEKAVSAVSGAETPDFGTLRPTTSQWTERYDKKQLASPKQVLVTPGYSYCSEPEPQYLPPGWSPYTHPEGQLYFFRNAPLRIVTESYLYDPQTLTKALHWSKHIESILEDKQIPLSQHIELFIYIEDDGCSYYLVDHAAHTEFWLEELDTSELGLSDVDSDSHLRLALTELYWAHVEYFPMHLGGLPAKVVDDLICVLSHALTDQLTSRTSTYFWSADECRQLLDVAKIARDRSADGHQVCALARIWRTIFRNRVETHYGQEIARLSRDQPIIYDATKPTKVFEIANLFTFKTAGRYHAKLSDIFVDRLVYIAQWQPFITNAVRDWQRTSLEAFCCLLLHIFLIYFPQCTPLAVGSSALLVASILSSAILAHRYKPLQGITASEAFTHLDAVHSEKYGFQFVAMAYALPTTFHLWGLGLLSANALCVLAAYIALCPTIAFCIVAVALVISLARLTSETQMSMPSIRSFSFFSRRRRTEDEVV